MAQTTPDQPEQFIPASMYLESQDQTEVQALSASPILPDKGFLRDEMISSIEAINDSNVSYVVPPEEHEEKYNRGSDAIEKANAKLISISRRDKLDENTVMIAGNKLHIRTPEDYDRIWREFVNHHEPAFREKYGYGRDEIEAIGVEKFIDLMDWSTPDDVKSFNTDVMHVVVCPECRDDFGIYEENVGLCKECQEQFDMDRFWAQYRAGLTNEEAAAQVASMIPLFWSIPQFRAMYRK